MTETYYSEESFDILTSFFDEDNTPVTPESLTYSIKNRATGGVVRTATVTPSTTSYTIPVTIGDNTITADETRKVVVKWTYNGGTKGDVKVYNYNLKLP
jgi:hypothetical protein